MFGKKYTYVFSKTICLMIACGVLTSASPLLGEENTSLRLAPLFSQGAVLQHGKPVPVWGLALAGEEIAVEFAGQSKTTLAGADGRWMVKLDPLAVSASSQILRVRQSKTGEVVEAGDILVGDVWLCSGQSNMARAVQEAPDAADFPLVRGWVSPQAPSAKPEFFNAGTWSVNPMPAGEGALGWSAVAYVFAREVHRETGIPIGLIMTSYGGTEIQSWLSEGALKNSGANESVQKRWDSRLAQLPEATEEWEKEFAIWKQESDEAAKRGEPPKRKSPRAPEGVGSRKQPASLYNGMVAPFIPFALRGILWYQGESDAGRHEDYQKLFTELIRSWRADFRQGDLPFYFVQLPNYEPKGNSPPRSWAFLRGAQSTVLALPNTGMAVTIDVGDANDLHPKNKLDVGLRLARHALKNEYGKAITATGPVFASASREGAVMRIKFQDNLKLEIRDVEGPAFEVAGADKMFSPATARIDGTDLLVSAPGVPEPVAVRYAWWNNPAVVLVGVDGLPASPFRSDDWPLRAEPREGFQAR